MNFLANTNPGAVVGIVFLVIGLLAAAGVLGFVLYKYVFSISIAKKQLKAIQNKQSYLSGLLIGNDAQYIHRLETISRTNILYIETYETFAKKFKDIHEVYDRSSQRAIMSAESVIKDKLHKQIKNSLEDARKAVEVFENQVLKLDKELHTIMKPEKDARAIIHVLKEKYRGVKQTYYVSQTDLELVTSSFSKTFDKLDQCFADFDEYIESAKYDEANALIPTIEKVIAALQDVLIKMPNLCALVISIIPEKITLINKEYSILENEDYPLWHLGYRSRLESWNSSLQTCKNKIISLQTKGVLDDCDRIQDEIFAFHELLEKEIASKEEFDANSSELYQDVLNLEKSFEKICSLLPKISSAYKIEEDENQKIIILNQNVDRLGASKRSLDVFIHSNTKQPYSILKNKLDELREDYNVVFEGVNDFKNYVNSLKSSIEEAYNLVYDYYYRLKSSEELIRSINVPNFEANYEEVIADIYDKLNEIYNLINIKPIDVTTINDKVELLKEVENRFFDEIDNKARECHLAESMIVYCNRDRSHQTDVNYQLNMLEERFYNGEFEDVYHEATSIFKRSHIEDRHHGQ